MRGSEEMLRLGKMSSIHQTVAQGEQRVERLVFAGLQMGCRKGQATRVASKPDRLCSLRVSSLLHFPQAVGQGESRSKDEQGTVISTIPTPVCARKTCPDWLREANKGRSDEESSSTSSSYTSSSSVFREGGGAMSSSMNVPLYMSSRSKRVSNQR